MRRYPPDQITGAKAPRLTGLSYRQVDHVLTSYRGRDTGQGSARDISPEELGILRLYRTLTDGGLVARTGGRDAVDWLQLLYLATAIPLEWWDRSALIIDRHGPEAVTWPPDADRGRLLAEHIAGRPVSIVFLEGLA